MKDSLLKQVQCEQVHRAPGNCLHGDQVFILCRKPPKKFYTSKIRSGKDQYFQGIARMNVIIKLEKGFINKQK